MSLSNVDHKGVRYELLGEKVESLSSEENQASMEGTGSVVGPGLEGLWHLYEVSAAVEDVECSQILQNIPFDIFPSKESDVAGGDGCESVSDPWSGFRPVSYLEGLVIHFITGK